MFVGSGFTIFQRANESSSASVAVWQRIRDAKSGDEAVNFDGDPGSIAGRYERYAKVDISTLIQDAIWVGILAAADFYRADSALTMITRSKRTSNSDGR